MKRDIPLLKVLLTFLIATFIFFSAFLIGYSVSYYKYQSVQASQESIKYNILGLELEKNFLDSCNPDILDIISSELEDMGNSINMLEDRLGKNNAQVINAKQQYTILEVQHLFNIKELNNACKKETSIILFFYSNLPPNDEGADRIGLMLNSLKEKYSSDIMIYSFDYDLKSDMVAILKSYYNVTSPSTLIINENTKILNPSNIEDVEKFLK